MEWESEVTITGSEESDKVHFQWETTDYKFWAPNENPLQLAAEFGGNQVDLSEEIGWIPCDAFPCKIADYDCTCTCGEIDLIDHYVFGNDVKDNEAFELLLRKMEGCVTGERQPEDVNVDVQHERPNDRPIAEAITSGSLMVLNGPIEVTPELIETAEKPIDESTAGPLQATFPTNPEPRNKRKSRLKHLRAVTAKIVDYNASLLSFLETAVNTNPELFLWDEQGRPYLNYNNK